MYFVEVESRLRENQAIAGTGGFYLNARVSLWSTCVPLLANDRADSSSLAAGRESLWVVERVQREWIRVVYAETYRGSRSPGRRAGGAIVLSTADGGKHAIILLSLAGQLIHLIQKERFGRRSREASRGNPR